MGWRDNLTPAMLGGVEFRIEERTESGGRRNVTHEYPRRDEPFTEDLGRRALRFSIRAFFIGVNYMDERDELVAVCKSRGPHEYIDHWRSVTLGEAIDVMVDEYRLVENFAEGAFARLDLTLSEAGLNVVPAALRGSIPVITPILTAAAAANQSAFLDLFDTLTGNSYLQSEAALVVGGVVDVVKRVGDRVQAIGEASAVSQELEAISSDADRLVRVPDELGVRLTSAAADMAALEPDARLRFDRMLELADVDRALRPTSGLTVNRVRAANNQAALASLLRRAAVVESARAAVSIDYTSSSDASGTRDRLVDLIDEELEAASVAGSDEAFAQLRQVLATSSTIIRGKGATTAQVGNVRSLTTEPAEVLAYRLFGDATRADEIVTRNRAVHPMFIPGGELIEFSAPASEETALPAQPPSGGGGPRRGR